MTAGNQGDGANPPENDDPFGYLYRAEGGPEDRDAATGRGYGGSGTTFQPGVPRTSYNQVRAVGERTYGGQPPVGGPPPHHPEPSPHYAAPETQPGGRAAARRRPEDGHGSGRPPRGNGLLIIAIAVAAAVVVGVGAAILFSDDKGDDEAKGGKSSSASPTDADQSSGADDESPSPTTTAPAELPSGDAATFTLGGDPTVENTVPGAEAQGGTYVGMNKPGASAAWTTKLSEGGAYKLYVRYGVPGKDMNLNLYVNGEKQGRPLNMGNFAKAEEGAWDKGWTETWASVNVSEGSNEFRIACESGNDCEVNLDRLWIAEADS